MKGRVDQAGRALVQISLRPSAQSTPTQLDAWIDTGFTGDLVLPLAPVTALALPQSGTVNAQLADGSIILMDTYDCLLEWFGQTRQIEVVPNNGQLPLLGIGLLRNHKLTIDYSLQSLEID